MKIAALHRIVLAAAVLSVSTSARADAGFAASLGKPLSGLAVMAQLKTQAQIPPQQAQGPAAPAEAWRKLLDAALRNGKFALDPETGAATYTLADSLTDPAGDVQNFRVLVLTTPPKDGRVTVIAVLLSLSQAKSIPGNAVLSEQWFLEVSASGRLTKGTFVEGTTRGTATVRKPPVLMDLADAETKSLFDDLVSFWTE